MYGSSRKLKIGYETAVGEEREEDEDKVDFSI